MCVFCEAGIVALFSIKALYWFCVALMSVFRTNSLSSNFCDENSCVYFNFQKILLSCFYLIKSRQHSSPDLIIKHRQSNKY